VLTELWHLVLVTRGLTGEWAAQCADEVTVKGAVLHEGFASGRGGGTTRSDGPSSATARPRTLVPLHADTAGSRVNSALADAMVGTSDPDDPRVN
jgi:hypothetical protein